MTRRAARLLGVALWATGGGCQSPSADDAVTSHVLAYMECDECTAGELLAVRADGDHATPILRTYVLDGPPDGQKDRKRQELFRWQAGVLHDSSPGFLPGSQRLFDNYTLRYRSRAANALRHIGTPAARAALCAAHLGPC